jgi:nucleoid-associated protein YgaU
MRWLRGVGAAAALALVLVGAPVALAGWGRLPAGWSSLARPDDGTLLLGALTVVGWLAWAAFTTSTLVEAVRLLGRDHRRLRLPLLGGLQQVSATLLLAVLALAPATSMSRSAEPVVAAAVPEPAPEPVVDKGEGQVDGYVVQPGDDLWTVAERLLGDGSRWRELVAANPDHLQDPTTRLATGTRLALPTTALRPPKVTVEHGDTLSGLALEHLGAAGRWPRIADANQSLIDDPDHIEVGWRLVIPDASTSTAGRADRDPDADTAGRARRDPTASHPQADRTASSSTAEPAAERAAPMPSEPAPTAGPTPASQATEASDAPDQPAVPLLGTLGTLAAAAIIGAVETRRALRLRERPVGRRLISPDSEAVGVRTAIGATQRPDQLAGLDAALRAIGRHCHEHGRPLPGLDRVVVGERGVTFEWVQPAGLPPSGFTGTAERWTVSVASPPAPTDHPCPYPALVSLGSTPDGDTVLVDAERSRVLGVAAEAVELRRSALAAMSVELACAPWAAEARLCVVGADARLVLMAGADRAEALAVAEAVTRLRRLAAERRAALAGTELAVLRVDPDRADAVAPVVFCLLDDVAPDVIAELDRLLDGPPVGVAVIVGVGDTASATWQVGGDVHAPTGRLGGTPGTLLAHAIPEATRAAVAELFRAADDAATTPAPWWGGAGVDRERDNVLALPQRAHRGEEPVDIVRLMPVVEHPQVLLIGPAELHGASGPQPTRSRQQLVELCAWLLEHPGSTGTAMAAGLAVAETTRRSNLSRLRTWLGCAPDGKPYLPEAYSGRVLLHPAVSSDWHRLQLLLAPGIDRVGDATLVEALDLIRGAPLANAAPGQWRWAEELRIDVSSALRDVGLVLTERALDRGDIDLARWAAARALVVAAEDEQLLCARIRTEHRAGNVAEVERLVGQVTRQARVLGVDLLPETVELCQQVLEGRVRARA